MQDRVFVIKPSTQFVIYLLIIIILTGIYLCLSEIAFSLKLILGFALICYAFKLYHSQRHAAISQFKWQQSNSFWQIQMRETFCDVEILGESILTPFVSLIRLKIAGRRWAVNCLLLPDSLEHDEYRRLIVLLRSTH